MTQNEHLITNVKFYLRVLENQKIIPNFFTSEEYLLKSEAVWAKENNLYGFATDIYEWLLPPMGFGGTPLNLINVYAGWPNTHSTDGTFLDYQFIYNPKDFQNMKGGHWKVFRKNVRKYPKRITGNLTYEKLEINEELDNITALMSNWCRHREIYDPNTFLRFIMQGNNRKGLFIDNHLVGINVWDSNYYYINFRCCVDDGSPFLNEYMRYLFYTDDEIVSQNKLVNDGGALDSKALYKFKLKLNPCEVSKIYSHTIK
jgi:hypothetical protein